LVQRAGLVTPRSMRSPADSRAPSTEVTAVGNSTDNGASDHQASGKQFISIPDSDELSSNLVGLDIYNGQNQDIGKIKDIALNGDGQTQAYIVSVGGFLGVGDHYVAVDPSAVNVTYKDNKWHATMNATANQLKAAPEFKYGGRCASRT
jgi:sporulation protein YlmC with PRC-barrel domain